MSSTDRLQRIARQHLDTSRFLGVDFIPVRIDVGSADAAADDSAVDSVVAGTPPEDAIECGEAPGAVSAVSSDSSAKEAALMELRDRHDATCPHCTTATGHTQTVFGEGSAAAGLMFIGEAPGEEEDRTGRPFVGRAGQKLDQIIAAMGLNRADVYIANVLKTRPPNNRTPLKHEVDACGPFLAEQIQIIQPRVIVTLGGPATKLMLDTDIGITRLRGQWAEYVDAAAGLTIPVMPTYHPAYLLRNYTPETRKQIWSDMQQVISALGPA